MNDDGIQPAIIERDRPRRFHRPSIRQVIAGPALVVAALITLTTVRLSAESPPSNQAGVAARFVPSDGAIVAERLDPVDGKPVERITQTARIGGYAIASEIPTAFSSALDVLVSSGVNLATASYWIQSMQQFTGSIQTARSRSVFVLTDAGVSDLMIYGGNLSLIFDPPALQLPASPDVGDTWHQHGDALPGARLHYDQRGRVVAVTDNARARQGCIATHNLITFSNPATDATLLSLDDEATWCPGAGIVTDVGTVTSSATTEIPRSTVVNLDQLDVTSQPLTPVHPPLPTIGTDAKLSPAAVPIVFADVSFGGSTVHGQTSLRPIPLDGGRLVVVEATTNDVVMLTSTADGALTEDWRRHPGGVVLSVSSVDGLIVTTSANRVVTAYSTDGTPRWTHALDDASVSGAAAAGNVVVVGTLSGSVYGLDAHSGVALWRHSLADSIVLPPVASDDRGVVAAADGELVAFSPTGDIAWSTTVPSIEAVVANSTIVAVAGEGSVQQFDTTTGVEVVRTPFPGSLVSIRLDEHQLVAFNDEAIVSIGIGSGDVLWRANGSRDAELVTGGVVVSGAGDIELFNAESGTPQSWRFDKSKYTEERLSSAADWCVPMDGSVLFVDTNLLVVRLAGGGS